MSGTVAKFFSILLWIVKCFLVRGQSAHPQKYASPIAVTSGVFSENRCWVGLDWEPYKNEKCLKLFDQNAPVHQMNYVDTKTFCKKQHAGDLVSIPDKEKQEFLENYLKFKNVKGNIWIGLDYKNDKKVYEWVDGSKYIYKNWAAGSPKNSSEFCTQMVLENPLYGNWSDGICTKKNVILCEKIQEWPISRLHEKIVNLTKKFDDYMIKFHPIGFIYVQYPKEKPPKELWPWTSWRDVSTEYEGLFFRSLGGNAESWGNIQYEAISEVTEVKSTNGGNDGRVLPKGKWSSHIHTGRLSNHPFGAYGIRFVRSDDEVRPKNMAIRIWRRIQ